MTPVQQLRSRISDVFRTDPRNQVGSGHVCQEEDLDEFEAAIRAECANRFDELRKEFIRCLRRTQVRYEILSGRMQACNEEPQKHDLSIFEIEGWRAEELDILKELQQHGNQ